MERYFFSCSHNRPVLFIWQIPDKLYLFLGDYQRMPRLAGVNIKKRERAFVFINFMAGNFALDNLGKDTVLHAAIVASISDATGALGLSIRPVTNEPRFDPLQITPHQRIRIFRPRHERTRHVKDGKGGCGQHVLGWLTHRTIMCSRNVPMQLFGKVPNGMQESCEPSRGRFGQSPTPALSTPVNGN